MLLVGRSTGLLCFETIFLSPVERCSKASNTGQNITF